MRGLDQLLFTLHSLLAQRYRNLLSMLGIGIGICAVIMLTSIGEGVRQYVIEEFTQFGTTLIAINPGKVTTMGAAVGVFGTTKPLTLSDCDALQQLPGVETVVPVVQGNAEVETTQRRRRTTVLGAGPALPQTFNMQVASGRFLPADDPHNPRAFAVLGSRLKQELFGQANPLGERIRIGGERYRVIGVMESKGQIIGFDMDDIVYIPAARGLAMFNREGLLEIDILYREQAAAERLVQRIKELFVARHGREDITITTQQQMLEVLDSILNLLTFAVGAIGGISLLVGGMGVLTMMTIMLRERRHEIGLLRALGSDRRQILTLFLAEAMVLSALGGLLGLLMGIALSLGLHQLIPKLPVHIAPSYVILAEVIAILVGLLAGVVPAWRATRLEPVEILHAE